MNRALTAAVILTLSTGSAVAETFECRPREGVYKPADVAKLEKASEHDEMLLEHVFHVQRGTGKIVGTAVFSNERYEIRILRNSETEYEVLSENKHADVLLLRIDQFEETWSFKYYAAWLGLFVVGECSYSQ